MNEGVDLTAFYLITATIATAAVYGHRRLDELL